MTWDTLDAFVQVAAYWRQVQIGLEQSGAHHPRSSGIGLVIFETPYLENDSTLILPNGSAGKNDPDRTEQLRVAYSGSHYTIYSTGRERGDSWSGPIKTFSHFELAGKYILACYDSAFQELAGLPRTLNRWIGQEPQSQWVTREIPPLPENAFRTLQFAKLGEPEMYFIGEPHEAMYTYPLSMTYRELTETFMYDVPRPG